ncbi:hypothetical protein FC91_GL001827 [Schleiferilactobacillus harbinensis DSM 16991]|uniref:Uncharacterized protein n=1 Tax=Schleiferilactobacillus harbinensis DSM 16991 TaxID=1122147 RepID=A0A0R1XP27_9LACO|nr:hypothetical protein FC91_GL001827 [Schleiferilactobacillus harbinensis DSM 16991]
MRSLRSIGPAYEERISVQRLFILKTKSENEVLRPLSLQKIQLRATIKKGN